MLPSTGIALGALFSGTSVALSAFGTHALKGRLDVYSMGIFDTATKYQFMHALAIILVALSMYNMTHRFSVYALRCFVGGIIIFSGSLYALTFTGERWLGAITPIGGVLFMAGWLLFGIAALKQ